MRTLSKNLFVVGALFFLLFFVYWGIQSSFFRKIQIQVHPLESGLDSTQFEIVKNEILSGIQLLPKSLWEIDSENLLSEIKKNTWIENVRLTRLFPNRLDIGVSLKKIAVVYVDEAGIWLPVAPDGTLLSKTTKMLIPDVPFLRGRRFYQSQQLRRQAIELLEQMPKTGNLTATSISEIYFEPKTGFEVLLTKSGLRIIFGSSDFNLKIKRVGQVLQYLDAKEIRGQLIDARFERKILVRLKSKKNGRLRH